MRSIQQGRLSLDASVSPVEHIDRCLGCRACETACPSGVQYGALLEHTRDHMEHTMRRSWFQRLLRRVMIEKVFPFPNRFRLALIPAIWAKRMDIGHLLPSFMREALKLAPEALNLRKLPEFSPAETTPSRGRIGLVSGCVMPVLFGGTHQSTIRLLNRLGYDVVIPRDQVCCGALYAHSGQLEMARGVARANLKAFEQADCDTVLINAAGCGSTLKEYHHLLQDDPNQKDSAEQFVGKVRDLSEWMDEVGWGALDALLEKGRRLASSAQGPSSKSLFRVSTTFHDACHLAHAQGITRQPRDLVKAVAGENYITLPESEICCGSAGSYNLTEPDMAGRLQRRKVSHIRKTESQIVVTTNPGCILQIESGLKEQGHGEVRVMHLADYLEEALQEIEDL